MDRCSETHIVLHIVLLLHIVALENRTCRMLVADVVQGLLKLLHPVSRMGGKRRSSI